MSEGLSIGLWSYVKVAAVLPVFVGRDVRAGPFEKKAKRNECARWGEGVLPGRWCHWDGVSIAITYYSGNGGAKFSKKIWVLPEIRRNWWCRRSSRVFNESAESGCP